MRGRSIKLARLGMCLVAASVLAFLAPRAEAQSATAQRAPPAELDFANPDSPNHDFVDPTTRRIVRPDIFLLPENSISDADFSAYQEGRLIAFWDKASDCQGEYMQAMHVIADSGDIERPLRREDIWNTYRPFVGRALDHFCPGASGGGRTFKAVPTHFYYRGIFLHPDYSWDTGRVPPGALLPAFVSADFRFYATRWTGARPGGQLETFTPRIYGFAGRTREAPNLAYNRDPSDPRVARLLAREYENFPRFTFLRALTVQALISERERRLRDEARMRANQAAIAARERARARAAEPQTPPMTLEEQRMATLLVLFGLGLVLEQSQCSAARMEGRYQEPWCD